MLELVQEPPIASKICCKCRVTKQVEGFYKNNKGGSASYCKECQAKAAKANREKNRARKDIPTPELKFCNGCSLEKIGLAFHKVRANTDGLATHCKECQANESKARRNKNKAREGIIFPESKNCLDCNITKSGTEFFKLRSAKDGLSDHCKKCDSIRSRKRLYGVLPGWYETTLAAQGGACAICRFVPGPGDRGLDLDHKHDGDPRGLLHSNCNFGIGQFREDVFIIGKAIDYLNSPNLGILYKINLPKDVRDKILDSQDYLCKICSIDLRGKKQCFDHDHDTGMIRGALCHGCNCGLGHFKDSVKLLQRAIEYLEMYSFAKAA
jgi:hypothetical protein